MRRLSDEGLRRVSTFKNLEEAEYFVGRVLETNVRRIKAWLEQGATGKLELIEISPQPVGLVLQRGCDRLLDGHRIKVILVKDASSVLGYRIHTAFVYP